METLLQLAGKGNIRDVESHWMAQLERNAAKPGAVVKMLPVLAKLVERDRVADAVTLAWTTLETLRERNPAEAVLEAAGPMLRLLNKSNEIREQVTGLFRNAYADREGLDGLIEISGIEGSRPVRRAFRIMQTCMQVQPESYVVGRHDDTTGRVDAIDRSSWEFDVFDAKGKVQTLDAIEFADQFTPAAADDYRVLRDFNIEQFEELRDKRPGDLVETLLQSVGKTIDTEELTELLCPRFISADQWSKWWSKARSAIKRSPNIIMEGRSPCMLTYHHEGRTLEDEVREEFRKLHEAAEQCSALDGYLRECRTRKQEPDQELLGWILQKLERQSVREQKNRKHAAFQTLLVLRRIEALLDQSGAEAKVLEYLRDNPNPVGAVLAVKDATLWQDACECLTSALPERRMEMLSELLPLAPVPCCDWVAAQLLESGYSEDQFNELVQGVLNDPVKYWSSLLWIWDGPSVEISADIRPITVLGKVLQLLTEAKRNDDIPAETKREMVISTRNILGARRLERYRACLEGIDVGMATALRTQLVRLDDQLGRAVGDDMLKLLRERFPKLTVAPKKATAWADEEVLWVTSGGMARKRAEIDDMINVKMKENAKRIGEAASHGDLSENSEYKFALEERDLLRARLAQMQEQMSKAQVIVPETIPTDYIGVGSRGVFRHVETGKEVKLAFLGPWDANTEKNIFNYKARFSQNLMGKRVGERVEVEVVEPPGQYEIVAVEPAV